jgi:hypothetical protein
MGSLGFAVLNSINSTIFVQRKTNWTGHSIANSCASTISTEKGKSGAWKVENLPPRRARLPEEQLYSCKRSFCG